MSLMVHMLSWFTHMGKMRVVWSGRKLGLFEACPHYRMPKENTPTEGKTVASFSVSLPRRTHGEGLACEQQYGIGKVVEGRPLLSNSRNTGSHAL